jgi:restriction endonuclease S subunit
LGKVNISENNVGLRLKNLGKKEKRFLLFFLLSKYGQQQIFRVGSGNVQLKFNVKDIDNLLIPNLSKFDLDYYEKFYNNIIFMNTKSKQLYKEAEELLLRELGLLDYQIKHILTFSTTKKEIDEAHRYDSEYFQPKYIEIIKKIERYEVISLANKEYFKIITGTYSEEYLSTGTNYIRSVNINEDLTIDLDTMYKIQEKIDTRFKVRAGDILTSRVGSIGTLGYVTDELNGSFISDNILRIRNTCDKLDNLYLSFYLKKIGTIFMERLQRGSVQQRLNQETLKEIKIPIIKESIQKQIAEKIQESHKLRNESKNLLEEAKRKVEEEIEK